MHDFAYKLPGSVREAVAMLEGSAEARPLAGGMSLLPAMKLGLARPPALVDLRKIRELSGIRPDRDHIEIGAMTRHTAVANSPQVRAAIPALARLAGGIGDRQVRNRGTIGGSIANNDPAACYPAGILGLGAVILTDRREIPADAFFGGMFETCLDPGELIVAVRFPIPRAAGYVKFHQPASRFALVGVFVARLQSGDIRVAVTGAASVVFRARELENALARDLSPAAAEAVKISAAGLASDIHAEADYRAHLIPILAARAVAQLHEDPAP